jgi:hypothetical protein
MLRRVVPTRVLVCALLACAAAQRPVQAPAFPLVPPLTSDQIFEQTLAKGKPQRCAALRAPLLPPCPPGAALRWTALA